MHQEPERLKRLVVPLTTIIGILNGRIRLADFNLPADAHVISIHNDYTRRALGIIIESETFDPVPVGMELQVIVTDMIVAEPAP